MISGDADRPAVAATTDPSNVVTNRDGAAIQAEAVRTLVQRMPVPGMRDSRAIRQHIVRPPHRPSKHPRISVAVVRASGIAINDLPRRPLLLQRMSHNRRAPVHLRVWAVTSNDW